MIELQYLRSHPIPKDNYCQPLFITALFGIAGKKNQSNGCLQGSSSLRLCAFIGYREFGGEVEGIRTALVIIVVRTATKPLARRSLKQYTRQKHSPGLRE